MLLVSATAAPDPSCNLHMHVSISRRSTFTILLCVFCPKP